MMIYLLLKHSHSGIRWITLFLILAAIINSFYKRKNNYSATDKKLNVFAVYFLHIQVIIGFGLYFISPKVVFSAESMSNAMLRFFLVEHVSLMIVAVILATLGYSISKKTTNDHKKHRRISVFYALTLAMILVAIPWPWQGLASAWI